MSLIGFIGFVGGALISLGYFEYSKELPLSDISGIVVDQEENIYLCLQFYGYIQKYSSDGKFEKNWRVETAKGGSINLEIKDKILLASTARGDAIEKYDLEGNILEIIRDYAYDFNKESTKFMDEDGKIYSVEGFFNREVISINGKGEKKSKIKMSLLNKIMQGPFICWLIFFTGIMGLTVIEKWKKHILKKDYTQQKLPINSP